MEINEALEKDNAAGADVLKDLDAIARSLSLLGMRYPNTFICICEDAGGTGEMTLQDAAAAIGWALDHLAEGE